MQGQQKLAPVFCPVTGEEVSMSAGTIDYAGVRYETCCAGCPEEFKKNPAKALKSAALKGKTVGVFLFDPISNARITGQTSKASSDYKGVRYLFTSTEEKATFDATPAKFLKAPTKEVLFCAVAGHAIKNYASAGGYQDINGTRYYTCCADCLAKLKADHKLATKAPESKVKNPMAMDAPKS